MYQKSFLRHNDEIKEDIFEKQFPLQNIPQEEIQKYTFIFLLNDFCSNNFCWCLFNKTGTGMFIYF